MMYLTFSNSFEYLQGTLLDRLSAQTVDPFVPQEIIMPSTALRRELELAYADRLGVCANVQFNYLARWLWTQMGRFIPINEVSPFSPDVLVWRVLDLFEQKSGLTGHTRLSSYLEKSDQLMRMELAGRVAKLMEHYITFRPDWLEKWGDGKAAGIPGAGAETLLDEAWQAELWRKITEQLGTGREHPSVTFFREVESASAGGSRGKDLPASAHVFCLSTIPPLYLDILRQLSKWSDIYLYVINPCQEYWFEIVDRKRLAYLMAKQKDECHEIGNSLLAEWGKQTQSMVDLLFTGENEIEERDSSFLPHSPDHMLATLQNSILDLTELDPGSITSDRSVEVHVCHSSTRELEVLHDQLLALFSADKSLRPNDVLVVTPDLAAAAPLVDAVFGTVPPDRRIPYTVTGRPRTHINPVAKALESLLNLVSGRFTANAVFELLRHPPIARKYGFTDDDQDAIHEWIRESGIRWGLDAAHREDLGFNASERNTFAEGMNRLFLAYAMGENGGIEEGYSSLFSVNGRLPAGSPEGSGALALGRFWRLMSSLRRWHSVMQAPADAAAWRGKLLETLDRFLAVDMEWLEDRREVEQAVSQLHENMLRGGSKSAMTLDVIRTALLEMLEEHARGGQPSGAVTFSALTSLRHLPYRVLCLIGMNHGSFPSARPPEEYDLMAKDWKRGDLQRRHDERNLFLDLVLAARDRLYISYTGRSIRDASPMPPSILVDQLLDYLAKACAENHADPESILAARSKLTVVHPLQAFSRSYFLPGKEDADPRKVSFRAEYCEALRQAMKEAEASPSGKASSPDFNDDDEEGGGDVDCRPFFETSLAPPPPEFRKVRLSHLLQFFRNPSRYLLRNRLDIQLSEGDEELEDDEVFLPDWKTRQALASRLLPAVLDESVSHKSILELARAGTEYPAGTLGGRLLDAEVSALVAYGQALRQDLGQAVLPPHHAVLHFSLDGETWELEGNFGDLRSRGLVRHRYDEVRAGDYLAGWIEHLFLCASAPEGVSAVTRWHSQDGAYTFRSVEDARDRLAELLALYRQGLSMPLHFFPKSAWEYVVNGDEISNALSKWHSTSYRPFGEDRDPAYRLALRGVPDPIDNEFIDCAKTVFGPMLSHIQDDRLL